MAATSITLRLNVRETEPTGDTCVICGDVPFLSAVDIGVLLGPDDFQAICYLCGGCADILNERCRDVRRD